MKTKLIALLLCVALLAVTASGCASFARLKDKPAPDDYSVYTEPEDTDDDSASEYDVDIDVPEDYKSSSSSSGSDITIEEQVIFDKEGIKITALDYKIDYYEEMEVVIENNSDIDVTISSVYVVIDGFLTKNCYLYSDVAAGKKAYEQLNIDLTDNEKTCIGDVGEIEMYINGKDEDYNEVFSLEYIQVFTSAYDGQDAEMTIPYTELVNDKGIKVGFLNIGGKEFRDNKCVNLYIENNTDMDVIISVDDVSVNGIMSTSFLDMTLPAGMKTINYMVIYEKELEENKIDTIEEIELKIKVRDDDFNSIFETDSITIKAN